MAYNPKNLDLEKAIRERSKAARHASLDYKPPKHFRVFRNLLIAAIVIAMTAVLYTIYWFVVATNMKEAMSDWIADRARQGVVASYQKIDVSGFPFKFKVVLTEPKLQTKDLFGASHQDLGGEKWLWQGGQASAEMKPWNFRQFTVDLSGAHDVTFEDKGGRYRFVGEAQKFFMATKIYADGWPERFQMNFAGVNFSEQNSKAIIAAKSGSINSERLRPGEAAGYGNAKTKTYSLKAYLEEVRLPNFLNLPLGLNVQKLSTELSVIGHLQPSITVQNLAKWRDRGGIIEIELLDATYGTLKTHATGTLALDKNLQPLAAMSANFQGFFPAINKLKNAGYIRSGDAAMAKLVLGVLSRRDNGGKRIISLPLTLQDGQFSAGPVPLMAVPAIDWGEDVPPPVKPSQF
ncbi:MAG: DUF2125 domain-containing protein [Rhodospirillaceae bacterium]|jgi:hypothetical protein|nr:DUF2125 domain-containing protein [Rhodospirillaceae bacterium]MBT4938747.1 DUF2125 domain-containing protein [Rhodospirillaceae bacterium]MBT5938807.1 DUF2125 domain-containing protein [Rhodospirillaceae bacterium]MBT7265323.1 DUF2125 domain-containing protein [Rhodospirillaceae bacterium]